MAESSKDGWTTVSRRQNRKKSVINESSAQKPSELPSTAREKASATQKSPNQSKLQSTEQKKSPAVQEARLLLKSQSTNLKKSSFVYIDATQPMTDNAVDTGNKYTPLLWRKTLRWMGMAHIIYLPLELRYQIYECFLPSTTRRISLNVEKGDRDNRDVDLGSLSQTCKQFHRELTKWFHGVKRDWVVSPNFGLLNPKDTVFELDIDEEFRYREAFHAPRGTPLFDGLHAWTSIPSRVMCDHTQTQSSNEDTWCKWCWAFQGPDNDLIRHLKISFHSKDKLDHFTPPYDQGRYDNGRALFVITKSISNLETMDAVVHWKVNGLCIDDNLQGHRCLSRRRITVPVADKYGARICCFGEFTRHTTGGNGPKISLWEKPGPGRPVLVTSVECPPS